jgi:alginate O-acetyltransferase complex protein AlgI
VRKVSATVILLNIGAGDKKLADSERLMLFTSPLFLFGFFPIFLLGYFAAPHRFRNAILLIFSLFFYAWGEPKFVFCVLFSALADWILTKIIVANTNSIVRRCAVAAAILGNVGMLAYFKYFNFFVDNINSLNQWRGVSPWWLPNVVLPMAISFIAFEKITYVVDIYRGVAAPARSFFFYLTYVFFFPKMMAGPIIKYHDICGQLESRNETMEDLRIGFLRMARGTAKKVLLANALGMAADSIFGMAPEQLTASQAWFGAFAFGFELYFDFSGYSDIAIGLARMMGIRLMENFNSPYIAESFTDFWRRWHISLTQWIREYLYFPLGGNRRGAVRTYFNLWICFLFSGLWHGAAWTFVCWGIFHGTMLIVERMGGLKLKAFLPRNLNVAMTFLLVTFGWVLFRSPTLRHGAGFYYAMFAPGRPCHFVVDFDPHLVFVFSVSWLICFLDIVPLVKSAQKSLQTTNFYAYGQTVVWSLLLSFAVGEMFASHIKTFLYFRF